MTEARDVSGWTWQLFDGADPAQATALDALERSGRVRQRHDEITAQIDDLARIRHPRARRDADVAAWRDEILDGIDPDVFGRWVYYPWSGSLVHLLPPAAYRELRLARNRHKITASEQARLAASTVAIVGLSAGNAIARTLCLEGVSERFKLADFDVLALSNLNRLEAGVQDLGVRKTVLLARRLAEMHPYVELSVWEAGLTEHTLDAFLTQPPVPSVLIEECDDLAMKLRLRERARALRLPVLMETSDRGMLDVERFDLEPDRPILHGLVEGVAADGLDDLTDDQRLGLVLAMVGADSISTRAAVSLIEMHETISTWPQLASEVILGGALTTVAVRRLLLGEPLTSGRRFVDVDGVLAAAPALGRADAGLRAGEPREHTASARRADEGPQAGDRVDPQIDPVLRFAVEHACLAPSGGNCQPWRFHAEGLQVWVVHDRQRSKNLLDTDDRGSLLALGAAIENLVIAAAGRGHAATIEWFPRPESASLVARVSLAPDDATRAGESARRAPALHRRVTTRARGTSAPLAAGDRLALTRAADGLGARVQFLIDPEDRAAIGAIVGECDRTRFLCPALHEEMMGEVRWTPAAAQATRNGLSLDTLGLTDAETGLFRLLARRDVTSALGALDAGRALTQLSAAALRGSSAVGLISTDEITPRGVLRAGRAFERLWLDASTLGIALQPLGAVTALFGMLRTPAVVVLNDREQARLRELEARFNRLFPAVTPGTALMLFRLSDAPAATARSLRLPLGHVLVAGPPPEEIAHA